VAETEWSDGDRSQFRENCALAFTCIHHPIASEMPSAGGGDGKAENNKNEFRLLNRDSKDSSPETNISLVYEPLFANTRQFVFTMY
jgi:hypothetical protein